METLYMLWVLPVLTRAFGELAVRLHQPITQPDPPPPVVEHLFSAVEHDSRWATSGEATG